MASTVLASRRTIGWDRPDETMTSVIAYWSRNALIACQAVAERVRALGWKHVDIINSDLGSSAGIASARREGFERVISLVALDQMFA